MRKFAEIYPDFQIVQQLAAQIPWWHNVILMDKIKSQKERIWYIQQTIELQGNLPTVEEIEAELARDSKVSV